MEKKKEHIGDPIVTFFNIVFVALIGWNTYCTYWWSKISSVQKQSAFIKVKDFPEFLPQIVDVGDIGAVDILVFLEVFLIIYLVCVWLGMLCRKGVAVKLVGIGYAVSTTLHVGVMFWCGYLNYIMVDFEIVKYNAVMYFIINAVLYVVGVIGHSCLKNRSYLFDWD